MSNATTSAPTRTARLKPSKIAKAVAPIEKDGAASSAVAMVLATALGHVEVLCQQHADARGPDSTSLHAQTLLGLAEKALKGFAPGADADEVLLFDEVAALLSGAEKIDKFQCPSMIERHVAIANVLCLVETASNSFGFSPEACEELAIGIKVGQPGASAPSRTSSSSANAQRAGDDALNQILLNGYNARQITTVQEEVATRASSLSECLRSLRDDADTPQSTALYWSLNGAADMADMIGLLADAVAGGSIKGDATAWLIGPNFAGEGRAAQT